MLKSFLGLLSAICGTLIVTSRINRSLWPVQLALSEYSWLVSLLGMYAALKKPRTGVGTICGLYGAALAAVPLTRIGQAAADMDAMMRAGLGEDYESRITPAMRPRLKASRWSLYRALRGNQDAALAAVVCDIPYTQTPTRSLKLDVYQPLAPPAIGQDYPAVIVFHGGGWRHGDKGGYFAPHNACLASQGYVVFDVQYRFTTTDGARWPAQLDDARAAIRWVKTQADAYHVDPERIALLGRSSGGQIALQAAYRACGDDADTRVAAVVAVYAPTDLRLTGPEHDPRVLWLLGDRSYKIPDRYADASPLDFARDDLPPTLLIHGYMDGLVSPMHMELLLNRLRATNTPAVALRVPWGRHGFDALMGGLGGQLTQYYLDRFLAWCLYGRRHEPVF